MIQWIGTNLVQILAQILVGVRGAGAAENLKGSVFDIGPAGNRSDGIAATGQSFYRVVRAGEVRHVTGGGGRRGAG